MASSKPGVFPKPPTTQNAVVSSSPITPSPQDLHLSTASHLTVDDVIRRRSHNLKQLASVYTDHYWKLMEDLRSKHRDYVWNYGFTPFHNNNNNNNNEDEENNNDEVNYGGTTACAFIGCRLKAMALTKFCKLHILSDERQVLYKPCQFVVKSASAGDITCGKPIMRSIVPAHCDTHKQKAQMHLNRALKKSGLPNISCTDVVTPKFHVLVTEFVREIQRKRRAASRENTKREIVKIESDK